MTHDEIEAVAEELAKAGGISWYPGRESGPLLKVVSDRYRDRARLAIGALDRHRAHKAGVASTESTEADLQLHPASAPTAPENRVRIGSTVIYRPPGEQRAYPCRVERIEGDQAYLVPHLQAWTGWVSLRMIIPITSEENSSQ